MTEPVRTSIVIDADHFDRTMGLVLDRLEKMHEQQAEAMAAAMRATVTDPVVVRSVMDEVAKAAQERATAAAGRGVWWLIKSAASRWLVIVLIVFMAAKFLGWDAAARIGKFLSGATA